jgi:hypothetical protein
MGGEIVETSVEEEASVLKLRCLARWGAERGGGREGRRNERECRVEGEGGGTGGGRREKSKTRAGLTRDRRTSPLFSPVSPRRTSPLVFHVHCQIHTDYKRCWRGGAGGPGLTVFCTGMTGLFCWTPEIAESLCLRC